MSRTGNRKKFGEALQKAQKNGFNHGAVKVTKKVQFQEEKLFVFDSVLKFLQGFCYLVVV